MKGLDDKVAVVSCEEGDGFGRAIALRLGAHGARVIVFGPHERSLGETVGEIAYGGGKARHVVGAPDSLNAAFRRALEVFGPIDLVISSIDPMSAECTRDLAPATSRVFLLTLGVTTQRSEGRFDRGLLVERAADPQKVAEDVTFLAATLDPDARCPHSSFKYF